MAHPTDLQATSPDPAHGGSAHGGGHGPVVEETAEARAEREQSERVVRTIERALGRRLGLALALIGAGLALGLLGFLNDERHPHVWLWALVATLVSCYGLALASAAKGLAD
jgi:hypothetical protein